MKYSNYHLKLTTIYGVISNREKNQNIVTEPHHYNTQKNLKAIVAMIAITLSAILTHRIPLKTMIR